MFQQQVPTSGERKVHIPRGLIASFAVGRILTQGPRGGLGGGTRLWKHMPNPRREALLNLSKEERILYPKMKEALLWRTAG